MQKQFETEESKNKHQNIFLEVPDYLLCRINDEIMEEPVILESGFTYEKEKILEHFQYNGSFDPITREKVNPEVLIFNKHIK